MSTNPTDPIEELVGTVVAASERIADGAQVARPTLERPPKPDFGDFSTNAALILAPIAKRPPREVAEQLGGTLADALGDSLDRFEVAGPGFLNLFMSDSWFLGAVGAVNSAGPAFGSGVASGRSERIHVEFVSANPTGPLTVAGGRHAAYGDSLARILVFAGHDVDREYYMNDAGGQFRLLGESIAARMTGGEIPEGGYEGDYVAEIAATLEQEGMGADDPEALARAGVDRIRETIERSLAGFRVGFDRWFSERSLHDSGAITAALELIESTDLVYESDGAKWLRTTERSDDKDRVIVRAGGEPTYFAADIAYHRDKVERGYDRLINVLGADHHGYVARLRVAIEAVGGDPERFEAPIMQLVHLVEGGERVQMSKRKGEFVTLDDLVGDIGVDAARFFLVQRSHDTTIDLDLDLARKRTNENPVFYVQYSHARICRIFEKALAGEETESDPEGDPADGLQLSEKALIARLLEFPAQIERAETRREPHGIASWSRELAADFNAFYRDCPVLKAPDELRDRRLELCTATRAVIASSLDLLGIEAPESM